MAQRVRGCTVQNEMRGVLERVFAGAAERILDFANSRDKNVTGGCVRCSVDERENSEDNEGAQVPRWKSSVSKNFDETVRLQSEKKQDWIRKIRKERLQGIEESASSAPRLASSSAASFPGRNEPGTHCSLLLRRMSYLL